MIRFIEAGDIFAIDGVTSYAHGCNCAGAMGKGIAVQFRDRFPEMYHEYKRICVEGLYKPGDVYDYDYGGGHVYNLGTQLTWRTNAKPEYIAESVRKMLACASRDGVKHIALPAIGAGLGGMQWADVKTLLISLASDHPDVTLHVVESYKKTT